MPRPGDPEQGMPVSDPDHREPGLRASLFCGDMVVILAGCGYALCHRIVFANLGVVWRPDSG
jgi:hypothetical protein